LQYYVQLKGFKDDLEITTMGKEIVTSHGLTQYVRFELSNKRFKYNFYVIDTDQYDILLGYDWIYKEKVKIEVYNNQIQVPSQKNDGIN